MSRKKKEHIRKSVQNMNIRFRFYVVMDRVIARRYILYKKAHLERKRRFRMKQLLKGVSYNERIMSTFRCSGCHELTDKIHCFWGSVFCTLCYYNPIVISSIVSATAKSVIQEDCSAAVDLIEMEKQEELKRELRKKIHPFVNEIVTEHTLLEDTFESVYDHCPRFLSLMCKGK